MANIELWLAKYMIPNNFVDYHGVGLLILTNYLMIILLCMSMKIQLGLYVFVTFLYFPSFSSYRQMNNTKEEIPT